MLGLEITLQILGIIALLLFIAVLIYVLYLLRKVNPKLDSLLEIITYYEKLKVVIADFMAGPGSTYLNIAKTVFTLISPKLTTRRKSK